MGCKIIAAALLLCCSAAQAQSTAITIPVTFSTGISTSNKTFDFTYGAEQFNLLGFSLAETTYDFYSACRMHGSENLHGTGVGVTGWLGGTQIFATGASARCPAGSFLAVVLNEPFASAFVDELIFFVPGLTALIVKDLVIAVPEPETYVLLLIGLAALSARSRLGSRLASKAPNSPRGAG